jgi:hypothetical protein
MLAALNISHLWNNTDDVREQCAEEGLQTSGQEVEAI